MKQKCIDIIVLLTMCILAGVVICPAIITAWLSLKNGITGYIKFFIWEPSYLYALTNSIIISFAASIGTVAVSIFAAYVFANVPFRGRSILYFLYIMILIMPFQVTLLPQYIVVQKTGIYNTLWALILPGIFTPFSAVLLTQIMKTVPNEMIEAARLETDSTCIIILKVVIPSIWPCIICAGVLSFAENWNAVSEPRFLMEDLNKMPLMYMLGGSLEGTSLIFATVTISMIIPFLLFSIFVAEIIEGIGECKLK